VGQPVGYRGSPLKFDQLRDAAEDCYRRLVGSIGIAVLIKNRSVTIETSTAHFGPDVYEIDTVAAAGR
jgi:hypothetical protein